ncbi:DDE_3 domain-containing protein [Trichonephila clavipes]|nr:DDE_3 domain-containing protein [Trichonephila clavipes]
MQTLLPTGGGIFQLDNAPIHAVGLAQSCFTKYEGEDKHSPWPAQSPDLNIIKSLWSILERSIRNEYSSSASLSELSQYLHKEWNNIPLNTSVNRCLSVSKLDYVQKVVLHTANKRFFINLRYFHYFDNHLYRDLEACMVERNILTRNSS